MFNKKFFDEVLSERHSAKSMEDPDGEQASIVMTLHDGAVMKLAEQVQADDGWVVFKVYPPDGKKPRAFKRAKDDRGPRFDLEQVAVAYGAIRSVHFTLDRKKHDAGFVK